MAKQRRARWDLYRAFLAVLRHGNLSAAGRFLGLAQPTVGRQVEALEAVLEVGPLFTRSQRGYLPTPAAIRLRPHAEAMEAAANALSRDAAGPAGEATVVRISAPEVLGIEVLPAILQECRQRFPWLVCELALSNEVSDLLRRDADIAVRMLRPKQAALVARKAGDVALGLFAHRRYIDRFGAPVSAIELAHHVLIGFDRQPPGKDILMPMPVRVSREMFAFRCDSDLGQVAALRAGWGIALCHVGVARRDPDLVPVLPGKFSLQLPLWIAMHGDLRRDQRRKALFDRLADALARFALTARR